jgi:hypothetical protein
MMIRWCFARTITVAAFATLVAGGWGDAAHAAAGETCETDEPGHVLPSGLGAFRVVADRAGDGAFVMLNLYRLREFPDYSASPELEPDTPISGAEAFEQLAATLDAELAQVGAEVIFRGEGTVPFVGPACERWDIVQLVRYPSYDAFIEFASLGTVINSIPFRLAVLEDSRVVPLTPDECSGRSAPPPGHAKPRRLGDRGRLRSQGRFGQCGPPSARPRR